MVIELIKPDEIEKFVELRNIFIDVFDLTVPALDEEQLKLAVEMHPVELEMSKNCHLDMTRTSVFF